MKKNKIAFLCIISLILSAPFAFTIFDFAHKLILREKSSYQFMMKRNYALKKTLIQINKKIKEDFFDVQFIPSKSINIKNGWLVLGDDFGNAFSESKGLLTFNRTQIDDLKKSLIEKNEWLKSKGIAFYIAIAPNKLTTYDSLIPIQKYNRKTKMQQVDSLCKKIGVNFIDMGGKFKDYDTLRLYHKTDTHWNGNGGFLGYLISMDSIQSDFPKSTFKKFDYNNIKLWSETESIGDLNQLLYNPKSEEYIHTEPIIQEAKVLPKELPIPDGYTKNPLSYESRFENQNGTLTFLAFRDSFLGYSSHFFRENFRKSIFIWNYKFDLEIIERENPNIVFWELVERDIDFLIQKNTFH